MGGSLAVAGSLNLLGFGGAVLLSVPLEVGAPSTNFGSGGGVSVTAIGSSWTAGTATIPATTLISMMGSNALTPAGAGTLVLVTPFLLRTSVVGTVVAFGTLTLTYVPEPATLLLSGLGVVGLALARRRRA